MAIFKSSPSACLQDNCGKLIISEEAGVYHATNNTSGFGTPNIQGSDITEAIITVTWPSGADEDYDVTSQIPSTVTGTIEFNAIEGDFPDGIYSIKTTYTTSSQVYTKTIKVLMLCHACCCVDKMWAKLPEKYYSLSDEQYAIETRNVMLASSLLSSLKGAGSCNKQSLVDDMLERIQRLCDFQNCNCQ